jgi:hypothetical protein
MVPERMLVVPLTATLNATVPLPDPVPAPDTVIHPAPLNADHEQPLPAVTANDPPPPADANPCPDGAIP